MKRARSMAVRHVTWRAAGLLLCAASCSNSANAAAPGWTPPVQQDYCQPSQLNQAGTGLAFQRAEPAGAPHRWTGWLRVPAQGDYRFLPTAPGVRLRIAGQNLAEGGGVLSLASDRWHAVQVTAPAALRGAAAEDAPWAWIPPQGRQQGVPRENLFAPVATVERP